MNRASAVVCGAVVGLLTAEATVWGPVALGFADTYEILDSTWVMGLFGLVVGAVGGVCVHTYRHRPAARRSREAPPSRPMTVTAQGAAIGAALGLVGSATGLASAPVHDGMLGTTLFGAALGGFMGLTVLALERAAVRD